MNPKKILLLRALPGLGDMLCATPVFAALRTNFPDAQITLIGMEWAKDWAKRYVGYIDRFIKFPGFPGMEQGWTSHTHFVEFLKDTVDEDYDVALQIHGSGTISNYFISLLGAKFFGGFYTPNYYRPDSDTFIEWREEESETGRYCRLLRCLGMPVKDESLIFPMTKRDELEFIHLTGELAKNKPIACIHPGASTVLRVCPIQVFVKVAEQLGRLGFQVVLTGQENETVYTRPISKMVATEVVDLTGRTTLGSLGQLIKNAELVICNDTGIAHLADATKTKSVVVFMENSPTRWAALDRSLHRAVDVRNFAADISNFPIQRVAEKILEEVYFLTGRS